MAMARHGATWPLVSSAPLDLVVIGSPGDKRVTLLQAALHQLQLPPARLVSYLDLIAGRIALPEIVRPGSVVRIESPGKDAAAEQALLAYGTDAAEREGCDHLNRDAVAALVPDPGRILPSRQWYLGYCALLQRITDQLATCPPHTLMNTPADIALMFDKPACHATLQRAGLPVPRTLGTVRDMGELLELMRQHDCPRVFVKLAHGSSASGVVAYQIHGRQQLATTTVELVRLGGELRLYNSRRIRTYRDLQDIATLINALCRQRIHVEQWLPKAGLGNGSFDLRMVVIAGRVRHAVVRHSRSPMTNLHLGNARGDLQAVQARLGPAAWAAACRTCEQALACFANSLYAGVDLLITPDYRRHAIGEVNAFGDLLPGLLFDGWDTYATEILAVRAIAAANMTDDQ